MSQHTIDAHDTEGDLHKRMVSSKSVEVRAAKCVCKKIVPTGGQLAVLHIFPRSRSSARHQEFGDGQYGALEYVCGWCMPSKSTPVIPRCFRTPLHLSHVNFLEEPYFRFTLWLQMFISLSGLNNSTPYYCWNPVLNFVAVEQS